MHNDWLAGWVTIKQIDTLPDKLADWLADWLIAPGKGWKYIPSSVWEMGRKKKKKRETMKVEAKTTQWENNAEASY